MTKPLFNLGQIVATPGALAAMEAAGQDPAELLSRHVTGDWGVAALASPASPLACHVRPNPCLTE